MQTNRGRGRNQGINVVIGSDNHTCSMMLIVAFASSNFRLEP